MTIIAKNLRRTTLISVGLSLFLIGIFISKYSVELVYIISVCFLAGAVLAILLKRKRKPIVILSLLIMFAIGFWRGSIYQQKLGKYDDYFGNSVSITATANEDAVYSDRKQLIFSATNVEVESNNLVGNIQIEGYGTPMVYKGDKVAVIGRMFPKRGDNIAGVSFALIEVKQTGGSIIDTLRRDFAAGMQNVLPEPLASFGMGLLIGQRSTLPEQLVQDLTIVGLIHIVAVSGYNLTVLVNISRRTSQNRSRYQAVALSALLIGLFLLFTGGSPSIVRAAVVSIIGLLGWYYGRDIKPMIILLLSAVLTVGFNPLYLWRSIGWYLSFTAFFGVLVLAPLLRNVLLKPSLRDKLLPQILTETFAAQLCTLPVILFIFGRLSVISILANVLVIPVVPFAMLASLVAGIYGMIGPFLFGGVMVLPARLLLEYILSISSFLAKAPYANVDFKLNSTQMLVSYGFVIGTSVILWLKSRKNAIVS